MKGSFSIFKISIVFLKLNGLNFVTLFLKCGKYWGNECQVGKK